MVQMLVFASGSREEASIFETENGGGKRRGKLEENGELETDPAVETPAGLVTSGASRPVRGK